MSITLKVQVLYGGR